MKEAACEIPSSCTSCSGPHGEWVDGCFDCNTASNNIVEKKLKEWGFPVHMVGYKYLVDAIKMANDPNCQGLHREIYPALALKYGKGISTVRGNLRMVCEKAWSDDLMTRLGISYEPGLVDLISRLAWEFKYNKEDL
jgi:hypothetical protein